MIIDVYSYLFLEYRRHGLELFSCVSKNERTIGNCFRITETTHKVVFIRKVIVFALLRHTIGLMILRHFFIQSEKFPALRVSHT